MFTILDTMHPLLFYSIFATLILTILAILKRWEDGLFIISFIIIIWFGLILNIIPVSKSSILLEPIHIIRTNSQIIAVSDNTIVPSSEILVYNSKDSELKIKQTIFKNVYNISNVLNKIVKYSYENLEPIEASNE